MNERLRKLRKALDLTQQEFADRIGIKRNSFANYETARNTPIDAIIVSICREFNVNEDWLKNGIGDMFLPTDRNADIEKLAKQLLSEESDSFKNRFITMLANLTVDEWEFLERIAMELSGTNTKEIADLYDEAPKTPEELEKEFPPTQDQHKEIG